jgi:hypothetical protein
LLIKWSIITTPGPGSQATAQGKLDGIDKTPVLSRQTL